MSAHRLSPLFDFRALAVVGASENSSYGSGPYRTLQALGFTGIYYPVNPRRAEVQGVRAYPDVASLPGPIDAAAIVVARENVPDAIRACAAKGARAIVVISAGFAEADERGAALQREITALAREHDLLLLGPNCFGAASLVSRSGAFTGSAMEAVRRGPVAVVSNSGGLLNEVISYGTARGMGFSHLAATGNEASLTAADLLDFYVDDDHTEVILAILETVRDPRLFVSVAERARAAGKPVVILKLGTSEKAARSALTHTGALAGSDAIHNALFRQMNVIRVADLDELVEVGALLAHGMQVLRQRPLERAAVIEISGGGKGMVCDAAEAAGVVLPELTDSAIEQIRPLLPRGMEPSNPLDTGLTWGGGEMATIFRPLLHALAGEPEVDVVISRFSIPREGDLGRLRSQIDVLLEVKAEHPDRLFAVLTRTADQVTDAWTQVVADHGVALLKGYGRGLAALGKVAAYSRIRRRREAAGAAGTSAARSTIPSGVHLADRSTTPSGVHLADRTALNEVEAKDLVRAVGIPAIATTLARTADEAVARACAHGFPAALKLVSPQVLHKSDVGGVLLGLTDADAVRAGFDRLERTAGALPETLFEGVAVQAMAQPGLELVLGAHRDPQFGPVLLFGLGGVLVEVLGDVSLRVAPLRPGDAAEMLDEIRGRTLLDGARGRPGVDRGAIEQALLRLSELMLATPVISSVDLNPVFAYPEGVLVVDARVTLAPAETLPA